jgi:hypothetical protein
MNMTLSFAPIVSLLAGILILVVPRLLKLHCCHPQLILVPGYPCYYAPQVNSNYFFYDGLYWVYAGGQLVTELLVRRSPGSS